MNFKDVGGDFGNLFVKSSPSPLCIQSYCRDVFAACGSFAWKPLHKRLECLGECSWCSQVWPNRLHIKNGRSPSMIMIRNTRVFSGLDLAT